MTQQIAVKMQYHRILRRYNLDCAFIAVYLSPSLEVTAAC